MTDACGKLIRIFFFLNGVNEHPVNTNHDFKPCDKIDATYSVLVLHILQIEQQEKSQFVHTSGERKFILLSDTSTNCS